MKHYYAPINEPGGHNTLKMLGDKMILFEKLESNLESYAMSWRSSAVFPMVVIDEFLDSGDAQALSSEFPDPSEGKIKQSRDYIFGKNKFEKSSFSDLSPRFNKLYTDLTSSRFERFLNALTGESVFVDIDFHGGGIHMGGAGSFLDMHVDFNYHPIRNTWKRKLNILIYFNESWKTAYGGELLLKNKKTQSSTSVAPVQNRCVIMLTDDFTLHGYDPISFPLGHYRKSIAAYAYEEISESIDPKMVRSTRWEPSGSGLLKRLIGHAWPTIIRTKSKFFSSGTAKNK